jgi:hypothetical protein
MRAHESVTRVLNPQVDQNASISVASSDSFRGFSESDDASIRLRLLGPSAPYKASRGSRDGALSESGLRADEALRYVFGT